MAREGGSSPWSPKSATVLVISISFCILLSAKIEEFCCSTMVIVEPVYYGHLGTNKMCPDYQGGLIFQVILHI